MNNPVYDNIGKGYSKYRRADSRIVNFIIELLNLPTGSTIAEIGAGTGNYSNALAQHGYLLKAIEPSSVMSDQSLTSDNIEWFNGVAEAIPLPDNSVDAALCIMSFHHFKSPEKAAAEMARICRNGPVMLFTFDPRQIPRPWIAEYFPSIWDTAYSVFPPLSEVETMLSNVTARNTTSVAFDLPHDLQDHFLAAGWRKPEMYLDPEIRACMSGFALANQKDVESGLEKLRRDIESGEWEKKNGLLRSMDRYDAGYRFTIAKKK